MAMSTNPLLQTEGWKAEVDLLRTLSKLDRYRQAMQPCRGLPVNSSVTMSVSDLGNMIWDTAHIERERCIAIAEKLLININAEDRTSILENLKKDILADEAKA